MSIEYKKICEGLTLSKCGETYWLNFEPNDMFGAIALEEHPIPQVRAAALEWAKQQFNPCRDIEEPEECPISNGPGGGRTLYKESKE